MPSITTWTRLEPAATDPADLAREAEARVHDPLWFLFRQWQLGEFQATDAGSPIVARTEVSSGAVTRFVPQPLTPGMRANGQAFDVRTDSLEARVEAEVPPEGGGTLRARGEAGAELAASLMEVGARKFVDALLEKYALAAMPEADPRGARRAALLAGKVLDGGAVRAALATSNPLSSVVTVAPALSAAEQTKVEAALRSWTAWFDGWIVPAKGGEAWRPEWLDHGFSLGTAGELTLTAPGYEGEPAWHAYDVVPDAKTGATEAPVTTKSPAMLPTLVRFPGMAASRFWELEGEEVRLVELIADGSLLRSVVLDFVLVAGDDWFQLPVTLPTGALHQVTRVEVQDTFGERIALPPLGDYRGERRFALWRLSGTSAPSLFLPPSSGSRLESTAVEQVDLFRDELSNLYWAIEERVDGLAGPVERSERVPLDRAPSTAAPPEAEVEYALLRPVPVGHFPLFPEGVTGSERLVSGAVLGTTGAQKASARTLTAGPILAAVIPAGLTLTRQYQLARRPDGAMALWVGRSTRPGAPPPSPEIAFDRLSPSKSNQ
ncbi:hypothetical protein P2318_24250 [Myxococcaceae bacterium GXIMD 01537]